MAPILRADGSAATMPPRFFGKDDPRPRPRRDPVQNVEKTRRARLDRLADLALGVHEHEGRLPALDVARLERGVRVRAVLEEARDGRVLP